jgi:hypothetical protein
MREFLKQYGNDYNTICTNIHTELAKAQERIKELRYVEIQQKQNECYNQKLISVGLLL